MLKFPFPIAVAVLLLVSGCRSDETNDVLFDSPESTADIQTLASITTGPVQRRTIQQEITCTGRIDIPPTDRISVHPKMEGQVSNLRYLPGDYVRKGALLLRIGNPRLIERQRNLLETLAQLQLAEKEMSRQQTLNAGDATTVERLDATTGRVALLRATYQGYVSELRQYGVDIDKLETAGTFQSSFGIYASSSGYVHSVLTNQGAMVMPTDKLMELAATGHEHLELDVPVHLTASLTTGQRVQYQMPTDTVLGEAEIVKINPMVDDQTGTLRVHCHLEGEGHQSLRPGVFVTAVIQVGPRVATGLPRDAVTKSGDAYYAFRVRDEGYEKMLLRDVEVTEDFVGFSNPGDGEWVTSGAYYLDE